MPTEVENKLNETVAELRQIADRNGAALEAATKRGEDMAAALEASRKESVGWSERYDAQTAERRAEAETARREIQELRTEMEAFLARGGGSGSEQGRAGDASATYERSFSGFGGFLRTVRDANAGYEERMDAAVADYTRAWGMEGREAQVRTYLGQNVQDGGALVPSHLANRIYETVRLISPIRDHATVLSISNGMELNVPIQTSDMFAQWVNEPDTRTETTNTTFGQVVIRAHEASVIPVASQQILEDAAFDLEAFIIRQMQLAFADLEGKAFVKGTGLGSPNGFARDPVGQGMQTYISGDNTNILPDNVIKMFYSLKSPYASRLAWGMARTTMAVIRTMKETSTSNYLWQPGLSGTQPDMLLGRPLFEIPDLGSPTTTNAIPIALADWANFYAILDRRQIQVIPDMVTRPGFKRWICRFRVGGNILLKEAGVLMRVSA